MSFTDIFIRRPVLASVVSLLILLVGLASGFSLPVRQFPELTNTKITITTAYPGANADVIRGFITTPMLQAVASAEGIDTLTSKSNQSVSTIELNLRLDALNLQNRSQFNGPSASPTSTDFGRVTTQSDAMNRWIQIQARIRF